MHCPTVKTSHIKLFIPGPIEVSPKTFRAFSTPMIGHRGASFQELYADLQPKLQQLFYTKNSIFLSTSSAWGVMEGAIRNLVRPGKKLLCCMNGAFSDKWFEVAKSNDMNVEKAQAEWGHPILPEMIESKLKEGGFDAVTIIHNETSTGTMSPLADLAAVVRKFPETLLIVDTVSSLSALPVKMDELGLDVMLAGTQKALALPPGMSVFGVSRRALDRAQSVPNRGYYFDFVEFQKFHEKNMTPATPSIPHVFALQSKMNEILEEGLDARFARHLEMAQLARKWIAGHGFKLFPESGYESISLSCVANTRNVDVAAWIKRLKERHNCIIDGGYGKLKGATFRISHMGDETVKTVSKLLEWLDDTKEG